MPLANSFLTDWIPAYSRSFCAFSRLWLKLPLSPPLIPAQVTTALHSQVKADSSAQQYVFLHRMALTLLLLADPLGLKLPTEYP